MKDTNSIRKAKINLPKYYNPDPMLVEWFRKRLALEEKRSKFSKEEAKAGKKLSNTFYKELKESGARKSEVLDKKIFQSMANLIYFFECIEITPKMRTIFEKDIIKLLDLKKTRDSAEAVGRGMDPWAYTFRENNLARLISNIVSQDIDNKDRIDFRIAILYQLQLIINDKVKRLMKNEFGFGGQIAKSSKEDFDNAAGWLAMMVKSIPDDFEEDYNRDIGFLPIFLTSKGGYVKKMAEKFS